MTIREVQLLERKLPPHKQGEVLARLRGPQDRVTLDGVQVLESFDIPRRSPSGDLVRLQLPQGMSTAEGIAWLEKDPRFEYVTSNDLRKISDVPEASPAPPSLPPHPGKISNDYDPVKLYGMERIAMPFAWEKSTGSNQGAVIAVIDTGMDMTHPDLVENLWTNPGEIPGDGIDNDGNGVVDDVNGFNAQAQTGDPADDIGHGSHCAGTIGARGDNGQGVVGVNWQAQLMPIKTMVNGQGTAADNIRALAYAAKMGARITSNSYGGEYNQAERDAFANTPLLHICAAGNESNDNDASPHYPKERPVGYPGNYEYDHIISVAATDARDRLANFSNYGPKNVDLAAPGVSTLSTVPGGKYDTKSGTSMACPHVAGVAGLIATMYPDASNEVIRTRLLANVDKIPNLKERVGTGGRLNAFKALEQDEIAPDAPSKLEVKPDGAWLDVSWVNSGDDGQQGQAYRYHIECGEFRSAGAAGESGKAQKVRIPASMGPVRVRLEDNVGNLGAAAEVAGHPSLKVLTPNWTSDGKWSQVDEPGRPPVWTDSPNGVYANNTNSALTSDFVNLTSLQKPVLRFAARYRLEPGGDFVYVEVNKKGSQDWKKLEDYTSFRDWEDHVIDLSKYTNSEVRFRFRLKSDGAKVEDGFWLDRPQIAGG